MKNESSRWHLIGGLEKSIGENTKKGMVLTPMNTNTSITLPYGMQPSDKALRLLTGVTNVTKINNFVLGNQVYLEKVLKKKTGILAMNLNITFGFKVHLMTIFHIH